MTIKKNTPPTSERPPAQPPPLPPPLESRRRVDGQSLGRLHGNAPPLSPRSNPSHPPPRSTHADSVRRGGDRSGSGNCNGHVLRTATVTAAAAVVAVTVVVAEHPGRRRRALPAPRSSRYEKSSQCKKLKILCISKKNTTWK
uniref:Uncharacterized protein n=1 Tax=Human betaherpesvirus 6A TaxID=32603 RepID=A0A2L2QA59_9BETA|nr:hypothetical protein [Human betaherpesvirus 6A]AVI07555.1 hypothetical protein [Human betaherpesvirus 6A]AVI07671.1 hypothetical protein [Human betaherpesvirus 6A]AVI07677.1 hypothetical protein [Human betaherpesvirus 6A]AVI07793.1 hypothetical protein [Human betaherpesvirus 6A]